MRTSFVRTLIVPVAAFCSHFVVCDELRAQIPKHASYQGVVVTSEHRKPGEKFAFNRLASDTPQVVFPSGNIARFVRVYDDSLVAVLINVASLTGSTETVYLNKKQRRFTLIEVGLLEATVEDIEIRPRTTYGTLR